MRLLSGRPRVEEPLAKRQQGQKTREQEHESLRLRIGRHSCEGVRLPAAATGRVLCTLSIQVKNNRKSACEALAISGAVLTRPEAEEERIDHIGAVRSRPGYADGAVLKEYAAIAAEHALIGRGEEGHGETGPREPGIVLNEETPAAGAVDLQVERAVDHCTQGARAASRVAEDDGWIYGRGSGVSSARRQD